MAPTLAEQGALAAAGRQEIWLDRACPANEWDLRVPVGSEQCLSIAVRQRYFGRAVPRLPYAA